MAVCETTARSCAAPSERKPHASLPATRACPIQPDPFRPSCVLGLPRPALGADAGDPSDRRMAAMARPGPRLLGRPPSRSPTAGRRSSGRCGRPRSAPATPARSSPAARSTPSPAPASSEVATALDLETGAVVWQERYEAPFKPMVMVGIHGAGPYSTPLVEGGKLFTLGISQVLTARDAATGKVAVAPRLRLRVQDHAALLRQLAVADPGRRQAGDRGGRRRQRRGARGRSGDRQRTSGGWRETAPRTARRSWSRSRGPGRSSPSRRSV